MLKPIYTEIAENQQQTANIWIETERQRNELLNKARLILMTAFAKGELIREKAQINFETTLLKQFSSSEQTLFYQLNIQTMIDKLSTVFLFELDRLANASKLINFESLITEENEHQNKNQQTNHLFNLIPSSNVFDMTEFLSIINN